MSIDFLMPKLGLTMEEGTILEWLVEDGTTVSPGTPVLRIETDKVESDVEASESGILHRLADVGSTHACGVTIALLLAPGETPPSRASAPAAAATGRPAVVDSAPRSQTPASTTRRTSSDGRLFVSPNARRVAAELGVDLADVIGSGPNGRIVSEDVEAAATRPAPNRPSTSRPGTTRPAVVTSSTLATPAARQLAELLGVDLAAVEFDPHDGRVTRDDVAAHVRRRLSTKSSDSAPLSPAPLSPASQPPTSVKRLSGMRGTIAKRMHSSLQQMAQLTLTVDADLDAVVADRESRQSDAIVPGFTDYVIAAAARALAENPIVNSQVTDEGIALLPDVHVGLAVALDEGLVVPVVRHADRLDLVALATETKRLATAARSGSLGLGDLEGGTFSVSALGMFGVDAFTPVINPPNTAILGVGRLRDDLVLGPKGKVTTAKRLTLSLTWDHRVFDGAPAAQFAQSIVRLLGDPTRLNA